MGDIIARFAGTGIGSLTLDQQYGTFESSEKPLSSKKYIQVILTAVWVAKRLYGVDLSAFLPIALPLIIIEDRFSCPFVADADLLEKAFELLFGGKDLKTPPSLRIAESLLDLLEAETIAQKTGLPVDVIVKMGDLRP